MKLYLIKSELYSIIMPKFTTRKIMEQNLEEQEVAKVSIKAIVSLVLSILGIFLSILGIFLMAIPTIIGLIFGHIALSEIKNSAGKLKGRGLALAGLIIGYITIAIIVIGIILAFVNPSLFGQADKAREKLVCVQMKSLANSLEMFKLDNGMYPETEEGLEALISNPDVDKYPLYALSGYLSSLPKDAWGTDMRYLKTGIGFDIVSFGADKKEGGEEGSADISFSNCK